MKPDAGTGIAFSGKAFSDKFAMDDPGLSKRGQGIGKIALLAKRKSHLETCLSQSPSVLRALWLILK